MRMEPSKLLDVASQTLIDCINAVKAGGQWIAGQIPDVLHQLITWTIMVGVIWTVALITVVTVGLLCTFKWMPQDSHKDCYGETCWRGSKIASCTIFSILTVLTGITFFIYIGDALQALIAPKLFLLEYAAELYKQHG